MRLALALVLLAACSSDDPAAVPSSPDAAPSTLPPGDAAAPADAGPADAAVDPLSTDRGAFFGEPHCSGFAFCEDFESGTIDPMRWSTAGTRPVIDETQHARGKKALHISVTGKLGSYLVTKVPFPAATNRYWGRVFVRFGQLPVPTTGDGGVSYSHWNLVAATGTGVAGEIRVGGQLQRGKNLFGVGTDNRGEPMGTGDWTTSDDDPKGSPRAVPVAEWMCLEWLHAGDANETHFYWDAVEHPSMATTPSKHGGNTNPFILPEFTQLAIGWAQYSEVTEPFELWLDEIVVDANRVGCVR